MLTELLASVQLALALVFLFSTAGKLRNPRRFALGLADYNVLPTRFVNFAAFLVIALEGLLALAHLTGRLLAIVLPLGIGLLASFAFVVGVNLKRGRPLSCHCFGRDGDTISRATLARLALLASGEAFLLEMHEPIYPTHLAPGDLGVAVFWATLLLIAGLWLSTVRDVVLVWRSVR